METTVYVVQELKGEKWKNISEESSDLTIVKDDYVWLKDLVEEEIRIAKIVTIINMKNNSIDEQISEIKVKEK